jgi:hypothetical protein
MDNLRVEATNCLSKVVESFEEKKEHDDLFKEEQLF